MLQRLCLILMNLKPFSDFCEFLQKMENRIMLIRLPNLQIVHRNGFLEFTTCSHIGSRLAPVASSDGVRAVRVEKVRGPYAGVRSYAGVGVSAGGPPDRAGGR